MGYDIYTGLLKVFALPTAVNGYARFVCDNGHPDFNQLKSKYPIEFIAGEGDDLSKALNLLHWVSAHIYHKGDYAGSVPQNSLDLLEYAYDKGYENGINCVCLAKILAECLLAVGLKARQVFIMPCSPYDGDNHVVTHVYINRFSKWVMLDPTLNAYITNNQGEYLSILELRNHLANQETIYFNKEAKYNDDEWTDESIKANTEYFAKNLFYFFMSELSTFGTPESPDNRCVLLSPEGYDAKQKDLSNIEYRIKKGWNVPQMQKRLDDVKKQKYYYCSSLDFEAPPQPS